MRPEFSDQCLWRFLSIIGRDLGVSKSMLTLVKCGPPMNGWFLPTLVTCTVQ